MEVETTKMNDIADPQQRQWKTRPFPNSTAMFQHLAELYPPQQWRWVLLPAHTAIMQQIAHLYPQMQGHALPWYPLQGNPPAGYTWEGFPLQYGVFLLPQAHPPKGYPNNVYPPPEPQLNELHFFGVLVVNYPPKGYPPPQQVDSPPEGYPTPMRYPNNVYPPPQQVDSPPEGYPTQMRYPNNVYPPPQQVDSPPEGYSTPMRYPNNVYPPPQQVDSPPEGYPTPMRYPNNVYPPPQKVDSPPEGYLTPMWYPNYVYHPPPSVQSYTHNQTGWGENNPQIQGVSELSTQGNIIMGPNGGNTNAVYLTNNIHLPGNRAIDISLDDFGASHIPGGEVLLLYRQV